MKIGILTHPQGANYGGILQCYALCTFLRKDGHEPIIIRREPDKSFFLWEWTRSILRFIHFPRYYRPNPVDKAIYIRPFIDKHLTRTLPLRSQARMKTVCRDFQLDAVIVGSDQVWRKDFAMTFGYNYFLDFVPHDVKKLSFAASFGLSEWQYDELQSKMLKQLLLGFVSVSVREFEAIGLLKDNLGIAASQQVDPTLLLEADDYLRIASPRLIHKDYVFVYWLGAKDSVEKKIEEVEKTGKKVVTMFLGDNDEQMSIEDWLSYIRYADYIVTDSFHGSVFSIIFEKQFEVLKNDSGGNGRITSLCEMLGIGMDTEKDYTKVNEKLNSFRNIAIDYLQTILNNR